MEDGFGIASVGAEGPTRPGQHSREAREVLGPAHRRHGAAPGSQPEPVSLRAGPPALRGAPSLRERASEQTGLELL